jgi:hypothetical protein
MPCRLDTWDAITSRGGVFNTFLLPPHYRRVERHAEEFGRLMGSGLWALLANFACTGETLETNATADLTATKASLQRMAGQYLQGADPRTPLASPLYANLSGLSPLLVVVGGRRSAARRLGAARPLGRHGGRRRDAIHRGRDAAHLPYLLRGDPRIRRGRSDDRGLDTLPYVSRGRRSGPQ